MSLRNRSTKAQKIKWLLSNPNVWRGFPRQFGHPLVHEELIFARMVVARLYAPNADWRRCDIAGLISAARKQRRNTRRAQ